MKSPYLSKNGENFINLLSVATYKDKFVMEVNAIGMTSKITYTRRELHSYQTLYETSSNVIFEKALDTAVQFIPTSQKAGEFNKGKWPYIINNLLHCGKI